MESKSIKPIANNKKAFHDYFVEDRFEAGIELFGTEVKAIRAGGVNLKDSWCSIDGGELLSTECTSAPMTRETCSTATATA